MARCTGAKRAWYEKYVGYCFGRVEVDGVMTKGEIVFNGTYITEDGHLQYELLEYKDEKYISQWLLDYKHFKPIVNQVRLPR